MDDRDSSPVRETEVDQTVPTRDELATEAAKLFSCQKYAESVDILNQLPEKKGGDPKVLHNLAISEYFCDGCSDPKKLLAVLSELKERSQELNRLSYEKLDNATLNGNNVSGSKENGTNLHSLSITDIGCNTYASEFDTYIITMNIATLLYHLHEYAHAFSVMERLYQNLDPFDEPIILHVCILFLDIALAANEARKAASVIRYLETFLGDGNISSNSADNGIATQHQSQNQGSKTSTHDISSSDSNMNVHDNSLSRTLSDDTFEYENLYSTLDRNAQRQTHGSRPSLNHAATAATADDLKLKLHIYKIRLLLLTRNLKAAKREIKLAMNSVRGSDSSTVLLLKSQVEYARGNYRKAVKLLMMRCSNQTESGMLGIYNNNLGCIHYSQKTPHTSGLFFAKALRNGIAVRRQVPLKLSTFSDEKSLLISYNFGIQNLTCGKPLAAARCFGKAVLAFYDRPLLWLRLAECCFLAFEKGILGKNGAESIIVNVVGSGTWRRLVVNNVKSDSKFSKEVNTGECKISLSFARYCLQTALFLLNRNEQNEKETVDTNKNSKQEKGILEASVSAYECMKKEENHMIRQAVLADLAYNELLLENPLKSLSISKMILEFKERSKIFIFLGHMYSAEALCKLNRVEEAAKHLSVYLDNDEVVLPYSDDNRVIWSLKGGVFGECEDMKSNINGSNDSIFIMANEAKGIIYLNMVGIYAARDELENARKSASKALFLLPNNPKALLAAIYVDLLQKKTDKAILKLKSFNHASYVSTNINMS